ncbi:LysR family transcriptional regulator [Roseomonas sp. WA12]
MGAANADWVTLRLLLEALELGSIARAALRCGIAHSAAAKRLRTLEEECGLPLLERSARGVRPTAAGEAMAQHARALFGLSSRFDEDLRAFATGGLGSARLHAAPSVIAGHDLGRILAAFMEARPGIRVELREASSSAILHELAEGRGDLGVITAGGEIPEPMEAWPWRRDRLVLLTPRGHPLAAQPDASFAEALDHPLIGLAGGGALSLLLAEAAQRLGRRLEFRFQVSGADAARSLVAAGLGLTVMPDGLADHGPPGPHAVPLRDPWALRALRLVARPGNGLPPAARLLRDHLRTSMRG